jgi:quinol monooxygenase YgiN
MLSASLQFHVGHDKRAEFVRAAENFVSTLRQVPGCLECRLLADCEVKGSYTVISQWEGRGPMRRFLESDDFRTLVEGTLDLAGFYDAAESTNGRGESRRLVDVERDHILVVLASTNWRIEGPMGAAAILGLPPSSLRSRMRRLRIERLPRASAPHETTTPDPTAQSTH